MLRAAMVGARSLPVRLANHIRDDSWDLFVVFGNIVYRQLLVLPTGEKKLAVAVDALAKLDVVETGGVSEAMEQLHVLQSKPV